MKFPKLGLGKLFRRKSSSDDDDFDDDFEDGDFGGDDFDDEDFDPDAPVGGSSDDTAPDAGEGDAGPDAGSDDTSPSDDLPAGDDIDGADGMPEGAAMDGDGETRPEGDGEAGGGGEDLEDVDFGDDDFGEDDFGDDDFEDEEEGGKPKFSRKKLIIVAAAVAGIGIIGGGSAWWFMGGDDGGSGGKAERQKPGVPFVEVNLPPKGGGGMLSPGGGGKGGSSLNTYATSEKGPGEGVAVAAVSAASFAALPKSSAENPLPDVPDAALIEQGQNGPLPKIGEKGRKSWQVYARPYDGNDARPKIAIIMSGLGLSQAATEAAIETLPGAISLAFNSYAQGNDAWVSRARQRGHEVLISLPMESNYFPLSDPGPQALLTALKPNENLSRLEFVLSRFAGYVGVLGSMGSRFTASEEHLKPVLDALNKRGLMYVDGGADKKSLAPKMATEINLPRAVADLTLDEVPSKAAIDKKLAELEKLARERSAVVAIAQAYPSTLERLATWAAGLEAKNISLVPVSALADKQILP